MTDAPLIDIRNATIYRGDTRVFEGLNLSIDQHEQAAVLGPNGSGKTTLLKVINREIYPVRRDDSWVRILGRETWNNTTTGLDVVLSGYLSSVGIQGLLSRQLTNEQKQHAAKVMQELGIESLADTRQQRRCLLGRALVHSPDTLILDEPTAGLDLSASFDYLARVRRQIAGGKSIVLVTHLLNEIPPDIQRLILLREGRIVADGPKEEVLTEDNLEKTYDTRVRIAKVDGYYLAYPPKPDRG
jgi:iron complex transport system ATP-binding protein